MRRTIFSISLMVIILIVIVGTVAMAEEGQGLNFLPILMTGEDCWPTDVPAGALPNQPPPVFCLIHDYGPDTAQPGANTWSDDFNHGLSFANFDNTQYRLFDDLGAWRIMFWRHADHWMVDLAPESQNGGEGGVQGHAILSPDQAFNFVNETLVVETTVAAGMAAYSAPNGGAWTDIVVSTDDDPDFVGRYGYDLFPEGWTVGCRLQPSRRPACALKANDGSPDGQSTKIWGMSWISIVGTESFGGYPGNGLENYWHECGVDEPDSNCREHFRLELNRTSLKIYVNDHLYFAQTGIPPLPDGLVDGDVYVYLVSSHVRHQADTIRYHWDNIMVNPDIQNNNGLERSIFGAFPPDSMFVGLLPAME